MRAGRILVLAVLCLPLLGLWYWKTYLTYAGEVSHFEARVRKKVTPADLQSWAVGLLSQYSTSQTAGASFPIESFPAYLRGLHKLPPFGFIFPATTNHPGYVKIVWGSGFRGHWGLLVGQTNWSELQGTREEEWQPGIYFWRDSRP